MTDFQYLTNDSEIQEKLKKNCRLYAKKDFMKIRDIEIRETFKDYDYILFVNNYMEFINNSTLKQEYDKIKKIKIEFTNFNDKYLRETTEDLGDILVPTRNYGEYNIDYITECMANGVDITEDSEIYLEPEMEEDTIEVKSYFLNTSLSGWCNGNFDTIARKLKNAIPSVKQQFTMFKTVDLAQARGKKVCAVYEDLQFSNEAFNRQLYCLFLPYTTLLICDIEELMIPAYENTYYHFGVIMPNNDKIINLQNC